MVVGWKNTQTWHLLSKTADNTSIWVHRWDFLRSLFSLKPSFSYLLICTSMDYQEIWPRLEATKTSSSNLQAHYLLFPSDVLRSLPGAGIMRIRQLKIMLYIYTYILIVSKFEIIHSNLLIKKLIHNLHGWCGGLN